MRDVGPQVVAIRPLQGPLQPNSLGVLFLVSYGSIMPQLLRQMASPIRELRRRTNWGSSAVVQTSKAPAQRGLAERLELLGARI